MCMSLIQYKQCIYFFFIYRCICILKRGNTYFSSNIHGLFRNIPHALQYTEDNFGFLSNKSKLFPPLSSSLNKTIGAFHFKEESERPWESGHHCRKHFCVILIWLWGAIYHPYTSIYIHIHPYTSISQQVKDSMGFRKVFLLVERYCRLLS